MATVAQTIAQRAYYWCAEADLGYDQWNRWDIRDGGEADCSSLGLWCAYEAGTIDQPSWGNSGTIASQLEPAGFRCVYPWEDSPIEGDILVNEADHVAIMLWDGLLAQASIDENGDIAGGDSGDQSGWETNVRGYYDFPWDFYLRYDGTEEANAGYSYEDYSDGDTGDGIIYEVHTDDGWLGAVNCANDSEEGYAGWRGKPIDGIRAYRADGQEIRIQAIMSNGDEWNWTTFTDSLYGSNDSGDGYSGDIDSGNYIVGLRVYGANIRVRTNGNWLGWSTGNEITQEGDDFAGEDLWKNESITAVQMRI